MMTNLNGFQRSLTSSVFVSCRACCIPPASHARHAVSGNCCSASCVGLGFLQGGEEEEAQSSLPIGGPCLFDPFILLRVSKSYFPRTSSLSSTSQPLCYFFFSRSLTTSAAHEEEEEKVEQEKKKKKKKNLTGSK